MKKPDVQRVAAFLAITALLAVIAAGAALMFVSIPAGNDKAFNIVLMAIVGYCGTGFGFYLGTSFGSSKKNEILAAKLLGPEPPEPPKE